MPSRLWGPLGSPVPPRAALLSERSRAVLPLVEEEDVDGAHGGHDPDQPAHVGGPGAQLPQVQPGENPEHSLSGCGASLALQGGGGPAP